MCALSCANCKISAACGQNITSAQSGQLPSQADRIYASRAMSQSEAMSSAPLKSHSLTWPLAPDAAGSSPHVRPLRGLPTCDVTCPQLFSELELFADVTSCPKPSCPDPSCTHTAAISAVYSQPLAG